MLLNLRTSQSFEDVVRDLGQVLKIKDADRMYDQHGVEVKSFSHLKQEFAAEDTFFISAGQARVNRSASRLARTSSEPNLRSSRAASRAKSARGSRGDSGDADGGTSVKVLIRGQRRIFFLSLSLPVILILGLILAILIKALTVGERFQLEKLSDIEIEFLNPDTETQLGRLNHTK